MKESKTITYTKANFKYQMKKFNHFFIVQIFPKKDIDTPLLKLSTEGQLEIKRFYCMDGPSGPMIDTPSTMRAALCHDALYELMRKGLLNRKKWRRQANREFKRLLKADGVWAFRRQYAFWAVKRFAANAAKAKNKRKLCTAP